MIRALRAGSHTLGKASEPAEGSSWKYPDEENPQFYADALVSWIEGDRFGIVTCDQVGVWQVTWFGPEVRRVNRADFNMAKGKVDALAPAQLKTLGLDKVNFAAREGGRKAQGKNQ